MIRLPVIHFTEKTTEGVLNVKSKYLCSKIFPGGTTLQNEDDCIPFVLLMRMQGPEMYI